MELNFTGLSTGSQPQSEPRHVKVLVIGSGPAGLSAALYAARAELNPVVLAGMALGGQVSLTHTVENYPGFPDGVGGTELVEKFQKQAERFGATIEYDSAVEVDFSQRPFLVKGYSAAYLAETVIVTTGATALQLNVPGEVELTGRGVSYCATCDGWFFKDKDVVVVGGGDSALEESIFLTRYARSITLVHRRDALRAGKILQKRAMENPKIRFIWNTVVRKIQGENALESLLLENVQTGETSELAAKGVFIFIGHSPNSAIFQGQLELDERGYVVANPLMETSVPGVYAAGEIADPNFRQVITSAGMGAAAAMRAIHYIQEHAQQDEQQPVPAN